VWITLRIAGIVSAQQHVDLDRVRALDLNRLRRSARRKIGET
jgi:hypothetical protein